MSITAPVKLILGKINSGTSSPSSFWSGGDYDGAPYSYTGTFTIYSVTAGYPYYQQNTNLYNANRS